MRHTLYEVCLGYKLVMWATKQAIVQNQAGQTLLGLVSKLKLEVVPSQFSSVIEVEMEEHTSRCTNDKPEGFVEGRERQ